MIDQLVESLFTFLQDPAFKSCLYICIFFAFACWLLSVVNDNYSQVDRLWSISPVVYTWVWLYHSNFQNKRMIILTMLTTLWGIRLTFNFARKGGYLPGGEDYRWAYLRKHMGNFLYQIFNFVFIALYQNILLFLMTFPGYIISSNSFTQFNFIDLFSIVLFLTCLAGETIADEQQWRFQNKKYDLIKTKNELNGDYAIGFLTAGLFQYSRHPNYFCEITLWWAYYLFSIASQYEKTGILDVLNPTIIGTVLLTLLFQGSTWFTEVISSHKYPLYKKYQNAVSRLIPWYSGNINLNK